MPAPLQILSVTQGPFVQQLIRSARASGIQFDVDWSDISRFVKFVNDGWGQDPGASGGWFPPRIFEGVPRLHLSRTLIILALTSYFTEAHTLRQQALVPSTMSATRSWCGAVDFPRADPPASPGPKLLEAMYVYTPAPVPNGSQTAIIESYGLQPLRPEVGIGLLYAFARAEGEIQGFSLPFLERDGQLLPVVMAELPTPSQASRFFLEPLNATRIDRHLERYYELFDISEPLDRAWNQTGIQLLEQLIGPGVVLV